MAATPKKVTALIPCFNEASSIGSVLRSFPIERLEHHGYTLEIVVIDNNSSDATADIAREHGATVLTEKRQGKGHAIKAGFDYIQDDVDYVVMLDGDDTYRPQEILRMLEPLESEFCSVVIGSRLGGRITTGSMATVNRIGNWFFSHLVRYAFRVNVTDVLTGYFAWKRSVVERMRQHLVSDGFAIEMEMITKMARLGEAIYSVPITYCARCGHSNLRPIRDGLRILNMFLRNLFWRARNPQRIAFVSDTVLPYFKGGKETRLYEISKRLARDGHDVHIYTMKWWEGPKTITHEGVHFHALCRRYELYRGSKRSMLEAMMFGLSVFKLLFARFDILDVDHMPFFPLYSARVVTWLKRKTLYATWHEVWGREYWFEYLGGPSGYIGYCIEWASFLLPDVIISNSIHTTKRLRSAGFHGEIKTIPLGVDLDNIYTAEPGEQKSDIIFIGRLLPHKNPDLLVKAMAIVKETYASVRCIIVGEGPERKNLLDLIATLGLADTILLYDKVEKHHDLYGLLKASKMLVLPSVREGFGLVAIEANAAGLPVITTSHPNNAAKDLIHEGVNGFVVEPSEKAIAERICHILSASATFEPRRNIEQYDWNIVAQNMQHAFKSALI